MNLHERIKKTYGIAETVQKTPDAMGITSFESIVAALSRLSTEKAQTVLMQLKKHEFDALLAKLRLKGKEKDLAYITHLYQSIPFIKKVSDIPSVPLSSKEPTQGTRGNKKAQEILEAAFGCEKALQLIDSIKHPFDMLRNYSGDELHLVLKAEPPSILAAILSFLKPSQVAEFLKRFPPAKKAALLKRIAQLKPISTDALHLAEESIAKKIQTMVPADNTIVDGSKILADIIRQMDIREEEKILSSLDEEHADVSKAIRKQVFSLEMLHLVPDRQIQKSLRQMDNSTLCILLARLDNVKRKKILQNISQHRARICLDEAEKLGTIPKETIQSAIHKLITILEEARYRADFTLSDCTK